MQARPLDLLRRADWLTHDRVVAYGGVLLVLELLILVFLALWQHGVFAADAHSPASDFASFYAAGKLALAGYTADTRLRPGGALLGAKAGYRH